MIKKRTVRSLIIVLTACAVLIAALIFSPDIIRFLWSAVMILLPFILAYFVSLVANHLADGLQKRFHLPRRFAAVLVIIITVGILGGIVGGIIWKIIEEVRQFYENSDTIYSNISTFWNNLSAQMSDIAEKLPSSIQGSLDNLYEQFMLSIANVINDIKILQTAGNVAKRLPNVLISIITFILSLYFMIADAEGIRRFFKQHIPGAVQIRMRQLKDEMKRYVGGYIKAQMIIMCFAFVILLIGLIILKVKYALLIALAVAIFDAFPFFGSGAVLIPWAIIEFFMGTPSRGVGFLIIYLSVLLLRQLIEPKIVGKNIGLHPLLTLMSMYTGYRIFSVGGLILGPLTLTLLISFYNVGAFDGIILFVKSAFKGFVKEIKSVINSLNSEGE